MERLVEIAAQIDKPLALGGLAAAVLFLIARRVLRLRIYSSLSPRSTARVLLHVVDRLFVIAVIAIVLGFVAYGLTLWVQGKPPQSEPKSVAMTATVRPPSIDMTVSLVMREEYERLKRGRPYLLERSSGAIRIVPANASIRQIMEREVVSGLDFWPDHDLDWARIGLDVKVVNNTSATILLSDGSVEVERSDPFEDPHHSARERRRARGSGLERWMGADPRLRGSLRHRSRRDRAAFRPTLSLRPEARRAR